MINLWCYIPNQPRRITTKIFQTKNSTIKLSNFSSQMKQKTQFQNRLWTIGSTGLGILPHKFVRSGFAVAQTNNIELAHVPTDKTTTIRAASKASSQHGGQDFKSCNCKTGCGSRCSCRKDGRLCNSRCHSSLSCKNKWWFMIYLWY